MAKNNECDLKSCFLCRSCLADWLPVVGTHKKNITLKKGQQVFKEGNPVTGIYFVYKGNIKVHKKWGNDKELIFRFAQQGDVLGHLGLGSNVFYPVSATALEESTVCYIDMDFFESTAVVNNNFAIKLMRFFANELQESEKRMRNLAHMHVKGRVAQAIITLKKQFGTDEKGYINIELSRQDIASFTGASYESLFRTINDLTEDGIIEITGKSILVKNEKLLVKLTEDN